MSKSDRDNQGNIIIKNDINQKHKERNLAKDGWSYRTAKFEDFDGQRYIIKISIARDGELESVYNGRIEKKLHSPNSWATKAHVNTTSIHSISNSNENVNNIQEVSKKIIKNSKKDTNATEKTKFSQAKVDKDITKQQNKVSDISQTAFKDTLQKVLDNLYVSAEQAALYRSETMARYSEKLFADPKAISRLAKANSKLAGRAMSYVLGKIKYYNGIKKLTPQEREVKQFLHEVEANYRAAMRKAKPVTKSKVGGGDDREAQFSIKKTVGGKNVVVIENNILENVPKSKWINTVKLAMTKFSDGIPITGRLIKVNVKSRNEFTQSKNSQKYKDNDKIIYTDKFKAAHNLDEIILASTNYINEDLKHERKDSIKQFARGEVLLMIEDRKYTVSVIVGLMSSNDMVLYDIIDLIAADFNLRNKKIDVTKDSKVFDDVTPIINSISNPNENVNNIQEVSKKIIENSKKDTDNTEKTKFSQAKVDNMDDSQENRQGKATA